MQLNDGRLLCYYLRKNGKIKIYNKNTFEKILKIDLIQILKEKIFNEAEKNDNNIYEELKFKSKISIKQLTNDIILIGFNKFIFGMNVLRNGCEYAVHKKEKKILDLNELTGERIIVFTENDVGVLKKRTK